MKQNRKQSYHAWKGNIALISAHQSNHFNSDSSVDTNGYKAQRHWASSREYASYKNSLLI